MEDYHSVNASDAGIVCWARAGGAEDVIPGVDQSGFNYYSYARDGFSLRTGEKIRVVTLAPSITETVAAIGGLDYVVGTDLYSNYPEEVIKRQEKGDISIVGGYTDPQLRMDPEIGPRRRHMRRRYGGARLHRQQATQVRGGLRGPLRCHGRREIVRQHLNHRFGLRP